MQEQDWFILHTGCDIFCQGDFSIFIGQLGQYYRIGGVTWKQMVLLEVWAVNQHNRWLNEQCVNSFYSPSPEYPALLIRWCEALRDSRPVDEIRSALLPGAKRPATTSYYIDPYIITNWIKYRKIALRF